MTSSKKHSRKPTHRATLGGYIRSEKYLIDERTAKTVDQIASETGIPVSTVKHWLIRDHREVCCQWWPMSAPMFQELRRRILPVSKAVAQEIIAAGKERR